MKDKSINMMTSGQPSYADDMKINRKAKEYNTAVNEVRQLNKERELLEKQGMLLTQMMFAQQKEEELNKLKKELEQMMAMQPPVGLPVSPFEAGGYGADPMAQQMGNVDPVTGMPLEQSPEMMGGMPPPTAPMGMA